LFTTRFVAIFLYTVLIGFLYKLTLCNFGRSSYLDFNLFFNFTKIPVRPVVFMATFMFTFSIYKKSTVSIISTVDS